jgi:molybdate-binding protein/DNA-binding XRE family transcriptional regulator
MAQRASFETDLRAGRWRRGWSQEELARRAGLSRAEVSAIETGRLVPSTAAALALAAAMECRVEDLFRLGPRETGQAVWAWPPARQPCRYWAAEVGGVVRLYPAEATALGVVPHDGVSDQDVPHRKDSGLDPRRTLVMACCDPAVGLLAAELAGRAGVRLLAFPRPSRTALALLGQGLVHVAGMHLSRADEPEGHAASVRSLLGAEFALVRVAHWEEGIAFSPALKIPSIKAALGARLRWIGREAGSGARQCLDEFWGGRQSPRRQALDHRGVAEAIRCGWADVGVCLRLVSEEVGLEFLRVRQEAYDLCFPTHSEGDPRIQLLLQIIRSPAYRKRLGELPGYDNAETGVLQHLG